jgi:hypothetical protein
MIRNVTQVSLCPFPQFLNKWLKIVNYTDKLWISLWVMGIKDRKYGLLSYYRVIFCPQDGLIA